jgi:hypothetical protein
LAMCNSCAWKWDSWYGVSDPPTCTREKFIGWRDKEPGRHQCLFSIFASRRKGQNRLVYTVLSTIPQFRVARLTLRLRRYYSSMKISSPHIWPPGTPPSNDSNGEVRQRTGGAKLRYKVASQRALRFRCSWNELSWTVKISHSSNANIPIAWSSNAAHQRYA